MKFTCSFLTAVYVYGLTIPMLGVSAQQFQEACGTPIPRPPTDSPLFPFSYEDAWGDVGAFACGAALGNTTGVEIQVQSIAGIVANQIAAVLSVCNANGNAEVRRTAQGLAVQRAEELGIVTRDLIVAVPECIDCLPAGIMAGLSQQLVEESVIGSWTEIYLFSDDGTEPDDLSELTSMGVIDTVSAALPQIAAVIRELGCTQISRSLFIEGFLNRCRLSAQDLSSEAMAEIGAEFIFLVCDRDTFEPNSQLEATAGATATFLAQAVVDADLICKERDPASLNPMPCELLEADIMAVVMGQVEAFFLGAAQQDTCGCGINEAAGQELMGILAVGWVSAAKNAFAETCIAASGGALRQEDVRIAIEPRMLTATIEVLAELTSSCGDVDPACGPSSPDCVQNNRMCGGTRTGEDRVRPCCDPDSRCFVRDETNFFCRAANRTIPPFWDGRIEQCTVPGP